MSANWPPCQQNKVPELAWKGKENFNEASVAKIFSRKPHFNRKDRAAFILITRSLGMS